MQDFFLKNVYFFLIFGGVQAFVSNKALEGYPAGFLTADCPGSMKPVEISKENLKYIEIFVSGTKPNPDGRKRNRYNYITVKEMAKDPTMDWSKRTIMFIPGWFTGIYLPFPLPIIIEIFYKNKGYNVWLLKIFPFMANEYPVAARTMMTVGKLVGEMIANIAEHQPGFDPKKMELLGLSLGGHTMSFIAKSFQNITGVKFSRVTGLDPSGPCFRNRGPGGRIDESDADFVDLILTNSGGLGMGAPVGHVNFYVNGGEIQPGDLYWMVCGPFCSHIRVVAIWLSAMIFPESFIAIKCDSVQDAKQRKCYDRKPMVTNVVGLNVDKKKTGIFYLSTRNNFPWFMGKNGLVKANDLVLKRLKDLNAIDVLRM